MAGQKDKNRKQQRTPRVVAPSEYKKVNRGGTGKAQPQVITSEARIDNIRLAVRRYMAEWLKVKGVELFSDDAFGTDLEIYVDGLVSLEESIPLFESSAKTIEPELTAQVQEAFVYGYQSVKDAPLVAMRGRHMEFFEPLTAKLEQNRAEARNRRKPNVRKPQAHVAQRVAKASNLVSA